MRAVAFGIQQGLILGVSILEMLQLVEVLSQGNHLLVCLSQVIVLLLGDVLQLLLVTLAELPFYELRVKLEFIELSLISSDLLVFLINQTLYGPGSLKTVLIMLSDFSIQLLLL